MTESTETQAPSNKEPLARLTSDVVCAYLSNNVVPASEVPEFIKSVSQALHQVVDRASASDGIKPTTQTPAVPIKKSVFPDRIICLEDGLSFKSLKRHLRTYYNLSPEEYRAKWGLPADYPMTASEYSARRANIAKEIGLGRGRSK